MRYALIKREALSCPVKWACSALGVSLSGYYAHRRRPLCARARSAAELTREIREIHQASRGCYGSPRIFSELKSRGRRCSRGRVERLMRRGGIHALRRQRFVTTTQSSGTVPLAANLLARRFTPGGLRAWVADLSALHTAEGLLYLAVVLDLRSRRVLGWSMNQQMSGQLALDALQMALGRGRPQIGQLHHSDRGGHYASGAYQALLGRHGLVPSMSRRGNCLDNAVVESFFATLKRELLYPGPPSSREAVRRMVFEYIEVFYNRRRRHSSLQYLSPLEYEKLNPVP